MYALYPRVAHLAASPSDNGGLFRVILPSSTALCASAYSNHNALYRPGYLSKDNSLATDSTRLTRRRCIELYRLGLPSSKNARHLCRDDTSRTTSQCSVTKPSRTYRDSAARYLGAAWLKTIRTPATSRGTHPSPGPSDTIPTLFAALDADVEVPSSRRSFGNSTMSLLSSPLAAVFFASPPIPLSHSPLLKNSSLAAVSLMRCSLPHASCKFAPMSAADSSRVFATDRSGFWRTSLESNGPCAFLQSGTAIVNTFSAAATQCLAVAQHARAA